MIVKIKLWPAELSALHGFLDSEANEYMESGKKKKFATLQSSKGIGNDINPVEQYSVDLFIVETYYEKNAGGKGYKTPLKILKELFDAIGKFPEEEGVKI